MSYSLSHSNLKNIHQALMVPWVDLVSFLGILYGKPPESMWGDYRGAGQKDEAWGGLALDSFIGMVNSYLALSQTKQN